MNDLRGTEVEHIQQKGGPDVVDRGEHPERNHRTEHHRRGGEIFQAQALGSIHRALHLYRAIGYCPLTAPNRSGKPLLSTDDIHFRYATAASASSRWICRSGIARAPRRSGCIMNAASLSARL